MVMMAKPRPPRARKLLERRGLRCLLGKHDEVWDRLRFAGEKWAVFVYYCNRCGRIAGDSQAHPGERP